MCSRRGRPSTPEDDRHPGVGVGVGQGVFDGRLGVALLPPLAQRLHTDFSTDPRFDNPRAPQVRLLGFDPDRLVEVGARVRDLFAAGAADPARIASELGNDVGDLDRVIQIGAPRTVASFLQRLGRTGRRSGGSRNCLFLALDDEQTLQAAGLLTKWAQGWVEPVTPPPSPRHIVAQQLLALALQENTVGLTSWPEWWHGLRTMQDHGADVLGYLVEQGFLETDGGLAFIGPEAERHFGRRHFMELMAAFTAPPEFLVYAGREEIGSVGDDVLLADADNAPRVLLLAGRT